MGKLVKGVSRVGTWYAAVDMAAEGDSSLESLRKAMQYPLIKNCDMPEEMRQDCVDLVITAIERFAGTPQSYESAARLVKETMDKKYNESWVVVIGQGFAFEVT